MWHGDDRLSAQAEPGGTVDPLNLVAAGDRDFVEFRVNAGSQAAGRRLLDLGLPHGALVVLIQRRDHTFVPTGGSHVQAGDRLLILADQSQRALLTAAFVTEGGSLRTEAPTHGRASPEFLRSGIRRGGRWRR